MIFYYVGEEDTESMIFYYVGEEDTESICGLLQESMIFYCKVCLIQLLGEEDTGI